MRLANLMTRHFDVAWQPARPVGMAQDEREMALSSMLPYTQHYDDATLMTKEYALVQVIKLDGLYFESLTAEQIKNFERQRNTVLRSIASPNRMVYVHLIRHCVAVYPAGESTNWFARYVNQRWRERCARQPFFVNDLYISIVRRQFRYGVPGLFDRLMNIGRHPNNAEPLQETFREQADDLYEASNLLLKTLSTYGAQRLGIERHDHDDSEGVSTSQIARFLHYLVNLEDVPCVLSDRPLCQQLAVSRLHVGHHVLEVEGVTQRRAAAILSMSEWPRTTRANMLDAFLHLPLEFVLTQSFQYVDRISSEEQLRRQGRRESHISASNAGEEIETGLKALGSGAAVNGLHHLTVLAHVPVQDSRQQTLSALNHAVDELARAFVNLNVKPVREVFALETFYWSQLPGQMTHLIGRRGKINSQNFAGFASLHNHAAGKLSGNLWGEAIMPLPTVSGTLYAFNFHREMEGMVAGHTAITADTGAGKTALLCALTSMADKASPRVFWFDNRHGAEVFLRAMGGQHLTLGVHDASGWNPFALADTPDNRAYLIDLQALMRCCYADAPTADDMERFKRAVAENYLLPPQDRRLRNIAWCYGHGELSRIMRVWHDDGANAGVFDNAEDSFDLSRCRHYGFEMEQLIKDGEARPELPVILSYPLHRIEQAMNGEPFMLVLEEGQNLVRHDYWQTRIDVWLMQIRRKNGIVIFVTPDAKYLYCETDAIEKQTVTKLFLPNPNAKARDYVEALGLTEEELTFIRDTPPETRQFLIRRGNESIKAVFDLSGPLAELIPILSSNDKGLGLMREVCAELKSDDPAVWVPVFITRAQQRNTATEDSNHRGTDLGGGVTIGLGQQNGISFQANASRNWGKSNGSETTYDNSLIEASNKLTIKSGGDTTLNGAQLSANSVKADIGGNLNITTLQDQTVYESHDKSAGGSISLCIPPICYGQMVSVTVQYSQNDINHNYQSAVGQSGIFAGSGGYDINVKGNTNLTGGAITTTGDKNDSTLSTASLTYSDLTNTQSTSVSGFGVSVSYGSSQSMMGNLANNANANAMGNAGKLDDGLFGAKDKDKQTSTTQSVITGNVKITGTGNAEIDAQSQQNADTLTSRDKDTANQALTNNYTLANIGELNKELQTQKENQRAANLAGQVMTSAIGDLAVKMRDEKDPTNTDWKPGSWQVTVLHGLAGVIQAGVAGGNLATGAASGVINEVMVGQLDQYLQSQGIDPIKNKDQYDTFMRAASTLTGLAVGAVTSGGDARNTAMSTDIAITATENNQIAHPIVIGPLVLATGCVVLSESCNQSLSNGLRFALDQSWKFFGTITGGGATTETLPIADPMKPLPGYEPSVGLGKGGYVETYPALEPGNWSSNNTGGNQIIEPNRNDGVFANPIHERSLDEYILMSKGGDSKDSQTKIPKPGISGKEGAKDVPSWAKGERPFVGESGKDFAERLLNDKYGKGNYKQGPGTEFNEIRKWGDRSFIDPK